MHTHKKYLPLFLALLVTSSLHSAQNPVLLAKNSMRATKIFLLLTATGSIGFCAAAYYFKKQIKQHPEQKGNLKTKQVLFQYIALACAFGSLFSTNRILNNAIATLP